MSQYLSEAFKKLDILNEETFSVGADGLEDFIKFEEEDEFDEIIDVIDPEAETIEDIEDSYVGKVILDCCVCHSKIYKDVEDVVIENDIANANEECPFCYTTDGFKVVGQVATFDEEEVEETDEKEIEEPKDEKELEESLPVRKSRRKRVREFLPTPPMPNVGGLLEDEDKDLDEFMDANITLDAKGFGGKDNNVSVLGGKLPLGKDKEVEEGLFGKNKREKTVALGTLDRGDRFSKNGYKYLVVRVDGNQEDFTVKPYGKQNPQDDVNSMGYVLMRGSDSVTKLEEGLFDFGKKKAAKKEQEKKTKLAQQQANRDRIAKEQEKADREKGQRIAQGWKETEDRKKEAEKEYNTNRKNNIKGSKVSNTGKAGVYYSGGDYYSEDLNESVNNVNVETDEDVINVATDDTGKVTVTTEPKTTENTMEDAEVITPIEPEVQNEINDNVEDGGEIEIDMDEFDEESFDELGEGYLKKVYENVNSFKTSNVSMIKDKLVLEGVINFTSGKSKKTNFVFGIREATKSGKVRFIGENKEIARGRKSFTVTGRVDNKKFLSESLNYNYGVKGANGKSQRLYGTVKRGK